MTALAIVTITVYVLAFVVNGVANGTLAAQVLIVASWTMGLVVAIVALASS